MAGLAGIIGDVAATSQGTTVAAMLQLMIKAPFHAGDQLRMDGVPVDICWSGHGDAFPNGHPLVVRRDDVVVVVAGQVFVDEPFHGALHCVPWVERLCHAWCTDDRARLEATLQTLNGTFAGVLVDPKTGRSALFTDRFGIQRVFLQDTRAGIRFASTASVLLQTSQRRGDFDEQGIAEMLLCGCTLGVQSLFAGITILPGATLLIVEPDGRQTRRSYFDRSAWEASQPLDGVAFTREYTAAFERAVSRQIGDARAALSLTGGLDSRMVLASATAAGHGLPCYTFSGPFREPSDVRIARTVAAVCGQPFSVLTVGYEFVTHVEDWFERAILVSDGYIGLSGAAELYANDLARHVAPVRITGNYGSEILRGARAVSADGARAEALCPDLVPRIREAAQRFTELGSGHPVSFAAFEQAPHHGYGRFAVEASRVTPRSPFLDNDLLALSYRAPIGLNGTTLSIDTVRATRPALLALSTDRGLLGSGSLPRRWARRAWGEASFKAEYLASHGMPNIVTRFPWLRDVLGMERRLLGHHKFYHLRALLRHEMQDYVRETLTSTDLPTCVSRDRVRSMIKDFYSDRSNHTSMIDSLLTLVVARRMLLQ